MFSTSPMKNMQGRLTVQAKTKVRGTPPTTAKTHRIRHSMEPKAIMDLQSPGRTQTEGFYENRFMR